MKNKKPLQFHPDTQAIIDKRMPSGFKMWWVRGRVINVAYIAKDSRFSSGQDTYVGVLDLDSGAGHDVRLWGTDYSIEMGDIVSLLGHEPATQQYLGHVRALAAHRNEMWWPTAGPYKTDVGEKPTPEEQNNWLKCCTRKGGWLLGNSWHNLRPLYHDVCDDIQSYVKANVPDNVDVGFVLEDAAQNSRPRLE